MRKFFLLFILIASVYIHCNAQNQKKIIFTYTNNSPIVDGDLNEGVWAECVSYSDFQQHDPTWNIPVSQKSEVKICYTQQGIYVGVMLYETAPDSILQEFGMRDNSVNADYFAIEFDPYNTMQDSYYFQITASGVQSEWRRTDGYYNAVWKSSVKILKNGWSAEMFIPFSAFTFPSKDIQQWRMQFYRYIRRHRELDSWCLEDKTNDNDIQFWSSTENLKSIKPPLRLFITPYINGLMQKDASESAWSNTINGGLDLKWGVNQSYTLDMTLLPDFSQIQSDNKVKNLTAFETVYGDYRPFFYESMSLFQMGDLIYSRRIGGTPINYSKVADSINSNEHIEDNPQSTQLINAFKFYGRSANGLAVGFFNAITNKALAYIDDNAGNRRSVETEPITNYSIFVIDKALKGKSNVFFSNANTFRGNHSTNANVSALGGNYYFAQGKYRLYLLSGMSRRATQDAFYSKQASEGYKGDFLFAKVNGKFQYQANGSFKDKKYNPNDLGINFINDEISANCSVSYREPNPFWKVLTMRNTLALDYATRWSTGMPTSYVWNYAFSTTTKKYTSLWGGLSWRPDKIFDYYEPRNGSFYKVPRYFSGNANLSTDYRKPFAIDIGYQSTWVYDYNGFNNYISVSPLARIGNHLNMRYTVWYSNSSGQRGYAGTDALSNSVFGKRTVQTTENSITAQYVIKNSLSLSFRTRYYWSKGKYFDFFSLNNDGTLSNSIEGYTSNHDFVYSAFNFDFSFNWDFAPGSSLMLTYKNELVYQLDNADKNYMQYLRYSFDNPMSNVLAIKILYFIDAGSQLKKRNKG